VDQTIFSWLGVSCHQWLPDGAHGDVGDPYFSEVLYNIYRSWPERRHTRQHQPQGASRCRALSNGFSPVCQAQLIKDRLWTALWLVNRPKMVKIFHPRHVSEDSRVSPNLADSIRYQVDRRYFLGNIPRRRSEPPDMANIDAGNPVGVCKRGFG
jgi:hypothetical protein